MAKIQIRNEVMFKAPTRVGLLADVTERISAVGVNILAIGAYDKGSNGEFLMITDDSRAARAALEDLDGEVDTQQVVVAEVPNRPGEIAAIARKLANQDINISQVFASSTGSAETTMIVLTAERESEVVALLEQPVVTS